MRTAANSFVHEVQGLDVKEISDIQFDQLERWFDHGDALFMRNQDLQTSDLVTFSRRFGELQGHVRHEYAMLGYPEVYVLSNIKEGNKTIGSAYAGDDWHLDLCFMREPARMAILYAIEIPHDDDGYLLGYTLFASVSDAYDTLDKDSRNRLENKICSMQYNRRQEEKRIQRLHDHPRLPMTDEQKAKTPDIWQPIFRTHPNTGRKTIYANKVNTFRIEGLSDKVSLPIIQSLQKHVTQPEKVYRHKWQVGDLLMWDIASAHHMAIGDYKLPQRRNLIRTFIKGGPVFLRHG
ncbi:MAG: TauD/TfdA family dioxygenase [Pseudomonadota bacterium]|nr:TauD/TfdA family dioxygenase [Pseudomonadota bacterium]